MKTVLLWAGLNILHCFRLPGFDMLGAGYIKGLTLSDKKFESTGVHCSDLLYIVKILAAPKTWHVTSDHMATEYYAKLYEYYCDWENGNIAYSK